MTNEERLIRQRHESVYRPLVNEFFQKSEENSYTDAELACMPALFLPACGRLYATSLVKLAIVGEETYGWLGRRLDKDRKAWQKGAFNAQNSFDAFQEEGPSLWRNRFWQYHFAVLEAVYGRKGLLADHNAILDGLAWSNRFAVEKKSKTAGITDRRFNRLRASSIKLSEFGNFVRVFAPDVILYTCHNDKMNSDAVLAPFATRVDALECAGFKIWTWRMGKTWIFQTWHPSYLMRKSVPMVPFADALREEMIRRGVFAPIGAKRHYYELTDTRVPILMRSLNKEADRITTFNSAISDKELSYRLLGSLALELIKQRATMTARLAVLLLNEIDRFKLNGGRFSPKGRGPCNVAEAAYRYFAVQNTKEGTELASAVANAFTTVWGTYAYA